MSAPGSNTPPAQTVPDEEQGVDLPMSMTASVILTNLPKDATQAMVEVEALDDRKGMGSTNVQSTSRVAVLQPFFDHALRLFKTACRVLSFLTAVMEVAGVFFACFS